MYKTEDYKKKIKEKTKKTRLLRNGLFAFITGGAICFFSEYLKVFYLRFLEEKDAYLAVTLTLTASHTSQAQARSSPSPALPMPLPRSPSTQEAKAMSSVSALKSSPYLAPSSCIAPSSAHSGESSIMSFPYFKFTIDNSQFIIHNS